MTEDFLGFYHLESYLFATVQARFHRDGKLDAFDFFSIIVWKANRAKSIIGRRLISQYNATLEAAVETLTKGLHAQSSAEARLHYLMTTGGFRLPMASAILCVLWPDEFTVYDVRVCASLGEFEKLGNRPADKVWEGYTEYLKAVRDREPKQLSLRDKDRLLWGQSAASQLRSDIASGFPKLENPSDVLAPTEIETGDVE